MNLKFTVCLLSLGILTSCVSPKIVQELEASKMETQAQNKKIKKKNIDLSTENTEFESQITQLQSSIDQLVKDSVRRSNSLVLAKVNYQEMSDAYELLTDKNSKLMAKKARESKKLLEKLQLAKEELQVKEDELNTIEQDLSLQQKQLSRTQEALQLREIKVIELEAVINRKDSVLLALKNRISSALLGFEGDGLTITQKNGKVYISLEEKLLFASGSWDVDKRGEEALSKLSAALESQIDINVLIEGHTDSIPFGGRGQIKDNWDLSVVRATAIVRIISSSSGIAQERLSAAGRGEFSPLASNATSEGRSANRRIEIILSPKLYDLYDLLEN
jgi:chemotaxis protein MotB